MLIAYASTGQEFAAQAQCEAMGYPCHVPRRVDLVRHQKRRRPDVVVSPFLPNYVFIGGDESAFHAVRRVKEIRPTMRFVGTNEARVLQLFINRVEADFALRLEQIEAGERVSEYQPGDLLTLMVGPFAGQLATFRRIVERPGAAFPMIEADVDVRLFGKPVVAVVDPINARRAAT